MPVGFHNEPDLTEEQIKSRNELRQATKHAVKIMIFGLILAVCTEYINIGMFDETIDFLTKPLSIILVAIGAIGTVLHVGTKV